MGIKKVPHKSHYYNKLLISVCFGISIIAFSLSIGVIGYHYFFNIPWVDSLLNASMILTGMGPVDRAVTNSAKVFASLYALYSGVAFLTSAAVIFSPIVHRFLHKFHADVEE